MITKVYSILAEYHMNKYSRNKTVAIRDLKHNWQLKEIAQKHLDKAKKLLIFSKDKQRLNNLAKMFFSVDMYKEASELYMYLENKDELLKIVDEVMNKPSWIKYFELDEQNLVFDTIIPILEWTGDKDKIISLLYDIIFEFKLSYSRGEYNPVYKVASYLKENSKNHLYDCFIQLSDKEDSSVWDCLSFASALIDTGDIQYIEVASQYLYDIFKNENFSLPFLTYIASSLSKIKDPRVLDYIKQYYPRDELEYNFVKNSLQNYGIKYPPIDELSKPIPKYSGTFLYNCKFIVSVPNDNDLNENRCTKKDITGWTDYQGQMETKRLCAGCIDYELKFCSYNQYKYLNNGLW